MPTRAQGNEEDAFYDEENAMATYELSAAMVETNEDEHLGSNLYAHECNESVKISDKVVQHTGKKQRPGVKGAARENLLEDMEFSLIKNLNE